MVNLALSEANDKKQLAYEAYDRIRNELNELKPKLNSLYDEIGMLQTQYEQVCSESQQEWTVFKQTLADFEERIGRKIEALQEAKDLEEKFLYMSVEKGITEDKAFLYSEASNFFRSEQNRLSAEKKQLIDEKHLEIPPDDSARNELLEALKQKRAEQKELLARHRSLKEQLTKSKLAFDEAKKEYLDIKNADFYDINEEREKEAQRKQILSQAQVPKEFWESATIKESGDIVDIYYGGDKDHAHGHISLNKNVIIYTRIPRLSTVI